MLIKSLGVFDVSAGLVLILASLTNMPSLILMIFGGVALSKSLLGMLKELGGWIDLVTGGALIVSIMIDIPILIAVILGVLIIQKGVVSFL